MMHVFISFSKYLGVKQLDHTVGVQLTLRNSQTVQSGCVILYSHQQLRVPVLPHPYQHLIWSVFLIQDNNRYTIVFHCFNIQQYFAVLIYNSISLLICIFLMLCIFPCSYLPLVYTLVKYCSNLHFLLGCLLFFITEFS